MNFENSSRCAYTTGGRQKNNQWTFKKQEVQLSFAAVTKYFSTRILEKVQLSCKDLLWKIWKLGLGI